MNWTFTPQITGLTTYRFPYDPVDARELTKFEDIMAEGITNLITSIQIRQMNDLSSRYWKKVYQC